MVKKVKNYKVTIYNKSNNELDNSIKLKNIGRESNTYFNHIVKNYDNLSDWNFFTQANPIDHLKNFESVINNFPKSKELASMYVDDCYFYTNGVFNNILICDSLGRPHHFENLSLNELWVELFEDEPPINYEFTAGCIFCITKEQIKIRTKEFYEKCLKISEEKRLAPWEFERIMSYIFDINYN